MTARGILLLPLLGCAGCLTLGGNRLTASTSHPSFRLVRSFTSEREYNRARDSARGLYRYASYSPGAIQFWTKDSAEPVRVMVIPAAACAQLVSDGRYVVITQHTLSAPQTTSEDIRPGVVCRSLYSARGIVLTQLPQEANHVSASDDGRFLVAYHSYDGAGDSSDVFFYDSLGRQLGQGRADGYPRVTYSANGDFVAVYSEIGDGYRLCTSRGALLCTARFTEFAGSGTVLYGVFPSNDGREVLLSTSKSVLLVDAAGKAAWSTPSTPVLAACLPGKGEAVRVLALDPDAARMVAPAICRVCLVDRSSGQVVDVIRNVIDCYFGPRLTLVRTTQGMDAYEAR